jgi:large subunit ribosomal protein L35
VKVKLKIDVKEVFNTMPKMKTHKATAKRFKITGRGKLLRRKQRRSHLRRRKSKRVLRSFSKDLPVAQADRKRVRRILGLRQRK